MKLYEFFEVIHEEDECCIHILEASSGWVFTAEGEAYNLEKMLKPVFLNAEIHLIQEAFKPPHSSPVHCIEGMVDDV